MSTAPIRKPAIGIDFSGQLQRCEWSLSECERPWLHHAPSGFVLGRMARSRVWPTVKSLFLHDANAGLLCSAWIPRPPLRVSTDGPRHQSPILLSFQKHWRWSPLPDQYTAGQ